MFEINFSKYGINSAIFLITILLFSLVLCSFLGGNCSKREGMTTSSTPEQIPTEYIGTDGSIANLNNNVVKTTNGGIIDTFNATNSSSSNSATQFKSDITGNYARLTNTQQTDDTNKTSTMIYTITVTDTSNNNNIIGKYIANITVPYVPSTPDNGSIVINGGGSYNGGGNIDHYSGTQYTDTYYNSVTGTTARIIQVNDTYAIVVTDPVNGTITYNTNSNINSTNFDSAIFYGL